MGILDIVRSLRATSMETYEALDAEEWPALLSHARRLYPEELLARFHHEMSDEDLLRWARATQHNEVIVCRSEGEIRATIEIGYRGARAECAITAERGVARRRVSRELFARACKRARSQGATSMVMVTRRGNRDAISMSSRRGWQTALCYQRSMILPKGEPAEPLWLIRDLTAPLGLPRVGGLLARLTGRTAPQD